MHRIIITALCLMAMGCATLTVPPQVSAAIQFCGQNGDCVSQTFTNLSTAKMSPQAVGKRIRVTSSVSGGTATIPATMTLEITETGLVTGSPTINCPLAAGDYRIFSSAVYGLTKAKPVWFRATGDTDDTVSIQRAVDSMSSVGDLMLARAYVISSSIAIGPHTRLIGAGRALTSVTQTNNSVPAFVLQAPPGEYNASLLIQDMTINAKMAVKVNVDRTTSDITTLSQGILKGGVVQRVTFNGTYTSGGDVNAMTAAIPTTDELLGYGYGVQLAKCFDWDIHDCFFNGLGIGAYIYGSDVNKLTNNRFSYNARAVHIGFDTPSNMGSSNQLDHNEYIEQFRYGHVTISGGRHNSIDGNSYFESYWQSACYIYTINDIDTQIGVVRFDDSTAYADGGSGKGSLANGYNGTTTPFLDLAPAYGMIVSNDRMQPGPFYGSTAIISGQTNHMVPAYGLIRSTYWNGGAAPVLATVVGNSPIFPLNGSVVDGVLRPNVRCPQVQYGEYDPLKISAYNPPPTVGGAGYVTAYPWYFDPTIADFALTSVNGADTLQVDLPVPTGIHRAYFEATFKRLTSTDADVSIQLINRTTGVPFGGGGTYLFNGYMVSTAAALTRERAWFQIPEGVSPDLYFMRIILNNTVRWLEAKITPTTDIFAVLGDNFPPILAGATASFTGTVTGARAGDRVSVGVYTGDGLAGVAMLSGICTVNDSVTVYMTNVSGSTIDPSGNNYYVTVTK